MASPMPPIARKLDVGEARDEEERDRALRDVVTREPAAAQDPGAEREAAGAADREERVGGQLGSPISVLVRQLMRSQKTPRKTIT